MNILLDNDLYALTMSQFIYDEPTLSQVEVRYELTNRGKHPLRFTLEQSPHQRKTFDPGPVELRARVKDLYQIPLDEAADQLERRLPNIGAYFKPEYLDWLSNQKLPPIDIAVDQKNNLEISYGGPWAVAMLVTTPLMAIISELHNQLLMVSGQGTMDLFSTLKSNIEKIQKYDLRIAEFGTRRRWGRDWQELAYRYAAKHAPGQILGTSNIGLSIETATKPIGSVAHELFMVATAVMPSPDPRQSQRNIMERWLGIYQGTKVPTVFLPDTFSTSIGLSACTGLLSRFDAIRQDSGDPIISGQYIVDALKKEDAPVNLLFSDSLTIDKMIELKQHFEPVANNISFGWGSGFVGGTSKLRPNFVIKPTEAYLNGATYKVFKISDDPIAKATGINPQEAIEYLSSYAVGSLSN